MGRSTFAPAFAATFAASSPDQEFGGGGGGGLSSLPWTAGKHRFWWHYTDAAGLSVNTDGTGGVPSVGNSVGAVLSGATSAMSDYSLARLPKSAGTVIRAADAVKLESTGLLWCNDMSSPASGGNSNLTASYDAADMTIAFRVYIAADVTAYTVFGWGVSAHCGLAVETDEKVYAGSPVALIGGAYDWSTAHNVLAVISSGTVTLYVDDFTTPVGTNAGHSGTVNRWWAYNHSGGTSAYYQAMFMAAQPFTQQSDRDAILEYLTNGGT